MGLSNIFSVSTLICLGITLLLVSLVAMFLMQRMNEQNHKIASMLGLVSTMAEELNFIRSRVQILSVGHTSSSNVPVNTVPTFQDHLIPVSDEESGEDDESDDEDEDEDEESDSDSGTDSEEDSVVDLTHDDIDDNIKTVNMGEPVAIESEEINANEDDEAEQSELDDDLESVDDNLEENDHTDMNVDDNFTLTNTDFIKSIDISANDESNKDTETYDFKKMSLNKLRNIVVEKGLASDASKLKKNDLLKLLGSE